MNLGKIFIAKTKNGPKKKKLYVIYFYLVPLKFKSEFLIALVIIFL